MDVVLEEELLRDGVDLLVRLVEAAGALVIFAGAAIAAVRFVAASLRDRRGRAFAPIRLDLGRHLALGLEFQLAADILKSAIAPTFTEIGQLAAVAAIRTALNFFLRQEIREEAAEEQREAHVTADRPPGGDAEGRPRTAT